MPLTGGGHVLMYRTKTVTNFCIHNMKPHRHTYKCSPHSTSTMHDREASEKCPYRLVVTRENHIWAKAVNTSTTLRTSQDMRVIQQVGTNVFPVAPLLFCFYTCLISPSRCVSRASATPLALVPACLFLRETFNRLARSDLISSNQIDEELV
jgi:hypothetical protein